MKMNRTDALIDDRWVNAPDHREIENPATGDIIGTGARCGADMVDAAVAAARAAFSAWGRTTAEERAAHLDAWADAVAARRDELVDVIVAELGAPLAVTREWHVDCAIDIIRAAARNARTYSFQSEVANSLVLRRPLGVVGCITPWNYPFYQIAAKVAPALAAGCTVLLKPAELTPLSAYLIAEAVQAAKLPKGVFNLVPGSGSVIGDLISSHPDIDVVSFTGSTQVGRIVASAASHNLKHVCLELGGKSASIVCADADFEAAVRGSVDSAVLNSGQTCTAWTRLLVPIERYDEAVQIAAARADELVVGDPRSEQTDLGPVVSKKQQNSIFDHIRGARERGARVVRGDASAPDGLDRGYYVRPTILSDLPVDDPASQEEIFGPVLVVHSFRDEDEALKIANGTRYGLSGAVWAGSQDHAMALASQMNTGQVDINGAAFNVDAPFGGWKESGIGRELGMAGLEEYTQITSIQR